MTRLVVVPKAPLPADVEGGIALSPDGRRLAYVANRDGQQQAYLQELDQFEGKPFPGTEGASNLAFSPDGRWLAFAAQRKIKKVAVTGGEPIEVSDIGEGRHGLSWESNDSILFNAGQISGIWRVPAAGGTPSTVTTLGPGELEHRYPEILPGGKVLLYSALMSTVTTDDLRVVVQSLETGQRRMIAAGASAGYLPAGRLAYVRGGTVFAVPFDLARLEVTCAPTLALQGVRETSQATPQIAYSQAGSMTYVPASDHQSQDTLVWVDRSGKEQPTTVSGAALRAPRLAPDLHRVAAIVRDDGRTGGADLWTHDLVRGTRDRLTFDGADTPLWAPDGSRLAYSARRNDVAEIHVKTLGGTTSDRRLATSPDTNFPFSWSPDGKFLAAVAVNVSTGNDIWVYGVDDPSSSRAFIKTPFREGGPTFSHDGRWIAYASLKSGHSEIYMSPFPGPGEEWTISTEGGSEPVWARKSGRLFYRQGDAMMGLDITTAPTLAVGKPRRLFEGRYNRSPGFWPDYDVTPDGERFLMVKGRGSEAPNRINVVLNWQEELTRVAPTK